MDLLAEAARLGIDTEYVDAQGQRRTVSPQVLENIVDALRPAGAAPVEAAVRPRARPPRPRLAFQGPNSRRWALAVQLYGIRSRRNWGHGDFSDLLSLIELAAQVGAAGVGVNPLHALFDDRPEEPSPYSPNSRQFLNPLYIDVTAIEDFQAVNPSEVERCRAAELVDYAGVAAAKRRGLRVAYDAFRRHATAAQREDLEAFRASNPAIEHFARFEMLRRRLKGPWWDWPAEWRTPEAAARQPLDPQAQTEIGFHQYIQWIADRQLMRCRDRARELGLAVGLYLDVAVGVRANGFDAWSDPTAVVRTLSIGAPPDALNTAGQNWGLAGFSGAGLEVSAFRPFRDMLRASMRYAGAIRLDHVLGLKRLYFIPDGVPADQGTYVRLPFDDLLWITSEESRAYECVVVGEDLGTVPKGFRQEIARWGLWSYRVLLFERGPNGSFLRPENYSERALVTFSTHDLPTFAGWTSGHDLAVKRALGIDPGESDEDRAAALAAARRALRRQGIKAFDFPSIVRYLAATPAKLQVVALEDTLGLEDQPNVPGTIDEHPNWRRRYPIDLEDLSKSEGLAAVVQAAAEGRRAVRSGPHSRR